jgi:hypothetical protein
MCGNPLEKAGPEVDDWGLMRARNLVGHKSSAVAPLANPFSDLANLAADDMPRARLPTTLFAQLAIEPLKV